MDNKRYELKGIIEAHQNDEGDYIIRFKNSDYKIFNKIQRAIFETFFEEVFCCDVCGEKINNITKSNKWHDFNNYCSDECKNNV